jgi:hypothetical protein
LPNKARLQNVISLTNLLRFVDVFGFDLFSQTGRDGAFFRFTNPFISDQHGLGEVLSTNSVSSNLYLVGAILESCLSLFLILGYDFSAAPPPWQEQDVPS